MLAFLGFLAGSYLVALQLVPLPLVPSLLVEQSLLRDVQVLVDVVGIQLS